MGLLKKSDISKSPSSNSIPDDVTPSDTASLPASSSDRILRGKNTQSEKRVLLTKLTDIEKTEIVHLPEPEPEPIPQSFPDQPVDLDAYDSDFSEPPIIQAEGVPEALVESREKASYDKGYQDAKQELESEIQEKSQALTDALDAIAKRTRFHLVSIRRRYIKFVDSHC